MNQPRRLIFKWVLGAMLLGFTFPAASWLVAILSHGDRSIVEAHAEQPSLWVTNLAPIVIRHMRPLADEEELELVTELRAGCPVRADEQRFRQILINLVSNALKYTAEGMVRLKSYRAGDLIVYEVEDTGAGISPDDMPKVFTAFEQTDVAKQRLDSTGLGLPVSLGMAQAMGGTIHANSLGPGHGSTFRLVLNVGTGEGTEHKMASLAHLVAA